jgi:hypothetical protein
VSDHDVLGVARPRVVLLPGGERPADRVQAPNELALVFDAVQNGPADPEIRNFSVIQFF